MHVSAPVRARYGDGGEGPCGPIIRASGAIHSASTGRRHDRARDVLKASTKPLTRFVIQTGRLHISRKSGFPKIRSMTVLSEGCSSAHYHRLLVATVEAEPLIAAPAAVDCPGWSPQREDCRQRSEEDEALAPRPRCRYPCGMWVTNNPLAAARPHMAHRRRMWWMVVTIALTLAGSASSSDLPPRPTRSRR